jgi:hypothetical protein
MIFLPHLPVAKIRILDRANVFASRFHVCCGPNGHDCLVPEHRIFMPWFAPINGGWWKKMPSHFNIRVFHIFFPSCPVPSSKTWQSGLDGLYVSIKKRQHKIWISNLGFFFPAKR